MVDAEIATHLARRGVYIPTCYRWDMEKTITLDSKGRVVIPPDLREGLGDHITIRKTEAGVLLVPGAKEDFLADFLRTLESEPRRTGKPANPSPERMKTIWHESVR
jgi:bifunctional DNA-binding transcriptional regulator/antitoxin component of YhaV-PrlF toxin-antitoxin module